MYFKNETYPPQKKLKVASKLQNLDATFYILFAFFIIKLKYFSQCYPDSKFIDKYRHLLWKQ